MARKTKFSFSLDEQNLKAIGRLVALCCCANEKLWIRAELCLSWPAHFLKNYFCESVERMGQDCELAQEITTAFNEVAEFPEYVGIKDRVACWSGFFAVLDERKLTNWYTSNSIITRLFDRLANEIGMSVEHFAQVAGMSANPLFKMRKFDTSPMLANVLRMAVTLSMGVEMTSEEDDGAGLSRQFASASDEEVADAARRLVEIRVEQIKNSEEDGNS